MPLRAYIDESMRQRKDDDCVYVLAAALVRDDHADAMRDALKRLRHKKTPTLHWYDATPGQRQRIASAISELPAASLVVVAFYEHRGDERARRRCLEALWSELIEMGVNHGTIASRCPSQDKLDLELLRRLRHRPGHDALRMEWTRYIEEPLLWCADAFASAVGWSFDEGPKRAVSLVLGFYVTSRQVQNALLVGYETANRPSGGPGKAPEHPHIGTQCPIGAWRHRGMFRQRRQGRRSVDSPPKLD